MSNQSSNSGGIGFFGALTLLFIGLKLGNVIDWPWPIVLMPLWGPLALVVAVVLGIGLVMGMIAMFASVGELLFGDKPKKRRLY